MTSVSILLAVPLAATLSAGLILALMPVMRRYALAHPNARSSHSVPTPQGGGIAILAAALAASVMLLAASDGGSPGAEPAVLGLAATALAFVGGIDDARPLRPSIRFAVQLVAVTAVVLATGGRLVPDAPLGLERAIEILAGIWFVNLINFTDGLDCLTLANMVPVTGALVLLGLSGTLPALPSLVAAALLGGLVGFAPFNRPVARLFMGDVGALPVGLIAAWLLYRLALEGGLAAALILPLYPVADATLTLLWRLWHRHAFWRPHRNHFFQIASDNGTSVPTIVGRVFSLNLALAALAAATLFWPIWPVTILSVAAAAGLVGLLLRRFTRPPLDAGSPGGDRE